MTDPPAGAEPTATATLLLEVEGMKCGGCVRAVEQRLAQQDGVRQASVNLLTRTAWLELDRAEERLPGLLHSLEELGFPARLRSEDDPSPSRRERLQERHWWQRWRQLVVALALVLVSGLGHLADAGAPALAATPWPSPGCMPWWPPWPWPALAGPSCWEDGAPPWPVPPAWTPWWGSAWEVPT